MAGSRTTDVIKGRASKNYTCAPASHSMQENNFSGLGPTISVDGRHSDKNQALALGGPDTLLEPGNAKKIAK